MHKHSGKFEMDYSMFKTEVSKRRRSATTRELTKRAYSAGKDVVSLAEGMPNEKTFPFTEIAVKLNDGSSFTLDEKELASALQYIPTQGYPPLLQSLREFQRRAHAPPLWESRDIVIVSGAQDGLSKTLEAIIGPGDPLLVHDPLYPGVEIVVAPHQAELIAIPQDEHGVIPEVLRETLRSRQLARKKMPKLMYINATGSNPTGVVIPLERRKEIYRIACDYNFLILDDDPYHFLHFEDEQPKSFLSLDTEGRVIRLDSFSKVISSGLRLGFITAAAPLIASIELHLQSSHLHAPTLSQVEIRDFRLELWPGYTTSIRQYEDGILMCAEITHKVMRQQTLLDILNECYQESTRDYKAIMYKLMKIWGYDRLMKHFANIRYFYKQRRDVIAALAEKHLSGLAEFTVPKGGFFLWIKVQGIKDTWKMIMHRGFKEGVIMAPGAAFMKDTSKPCNAIRASFAKASYEEMDLALQRLADLIRYELRRNYIIMTDSS